MRLKYIVTALALAVSLMLVVPATAAAATAHLGAEAHQAKSICKRVDRIKRLDDAQKTELRAACEQLAAAVDLANANRRTATEQARSELKAAGTVMRDACKAARESGDRQACKDARTAFRAATRKFKDDTRAARETFRTEVKAAGDVFKAAVRETLGALAGLRNAA